MQSKNRDTDVKDGPMDTVGEGEVNMNWESCVSTYTLPCVKQIGSRKWLCHTGSSAQGSVVTQSGRMGLGREGDSREGIHVYLLLCQLRSV